MCTDTFLAKVFDFDGPNRGPLENIRSLNDLLGFIAIFFASFTFGYTDPFFGGGLGEGEPTWHIRPVEFPIWEVIFLFGGACLLISTHRSKHVILSHAFLFVAWMMFGITWMIYGTIYRPDYVFAIGVLGVFMSAQHALIAKLWAYEAVN
jgi:hypothetical protein